MDGLQTRDASQPRVDNEFTRFHVFVNRHGEIRAGWRMTLFFLLFATLALVLTAPVVLVLQAATMLVNAAMVLALLLSTWIVVRYVNHKPLAAVGIGYSRVALRHFSLGCLAGFLMMAGVFLVEYLLGYVHVESLGFGAGEIAQRLLGAAGFFLLAAASEELLFRGYLFQTLMQAVTFLPAALILSVIFALAHMANPHVTTFAVVNVGLAGLWLSFAYLKTRSLWLPIGLHAAWNFSQTALFGFRTSGQVFSGKEILGLAQSGPAWITGGDFGPEGGVLATIALAAGTWYIIQSGMLTVPPGAVTLDSLEDILPTTAAKEH